MKNIKQSLLKYKVVHNHNDLPLIQNRKLLRAISVEQIFEKVKQNAEQVDNHDEKKGLLKKMFVKNVNFDGASESERMEQQIRSRSLTNRIYRSKGNDEKMINDKVKISKRSSDHPNKNLDTQIQQQGLQLKNIDWHRQHVNQVLNNIIQQKLNTQSDKKFNTMTMSQNNLLKYERTTTKKIKQQNEFEKLVSPDVPLLSFRQFAKLQGFKLPQFLQ